MERAAQMSTGASVDATWRRDAKRGEQTVYLGNPLRLRWPSEDCDDRERPAAESEPHAGLRAAAKPRVAVHIAGTHARRLSPSCEPGGSGTIADLRDDDCDIVGRQVPEALHAERLAGWKRERPGLEKCLAMFASDAPAPSSRKERVHAGSADDLPRLRGARRRRVPAIREPRRLRRKHRDHHSCASKRSPKRSHDADTTSRA